MITLASLTVYAKMAVKAIIIYILGKIFIKKIVGWIEKALAKTQIDSMLHKYIASAVKWILWVEVVIAIMSAFGFNASSLLTVLAAAGAAVALALQGSLSNFASGVMLMLTKPFKKGDYIISGGNEGIVEQIDLMATTLTTVDNKVVIVPNGSLTGTTIVNASKKDTRRVDMQIGVAYNTDVEYVKKVICDFCAKDERIFKDPAPWCEVTQYADSAIELEIRVWCASADYWGVKFDTQSALKGVLTEAGIAIPFPQMDVTIKNK